MTMGQKLKAEYPMNKYECKMYYRLGRTDAAA